MAHLASSIHLYNNTAATTTTTTQHSKFGKTFMGIILSQRKSVFLFIKTGEGGGNGAGTVKAYKASE